MKIIGLTGGIAMGKSTAAAMLRAMGLPVHDSDAAVHGLYARGGAAVPAIAKHFPGAVRDDAVDRAALSQLVLGKPDALTTLEALMHPLVRAHSDRWLQGQRARRARAVVLDIPLLFEAGRADEMDEIWLVDCPPFLQAQRALARPGMTAGKLAAIRARQWPQAKRRKHAHHIFPTGRGKAALRQGLAPHVSRLQSGGGSRCVDS